MTTKKFIILAITAFILFLLGLYVYADDVLPCDKASPLSGQLTIGYDSRYMFRGVEVFPNHSSLLSSDLSVSLDGFTADIWGAAAGTGDYKEIDYTLSYTHSLFSDLNGTVGYIYYSYPTERIPNTQEVFVGLSLDKWEFVTPSVTYWYDFDQLQASYLEARLTGHVKVCSHFTLNPYVAASYSFRYNSPKNAFNDIEMGVSGDIILTSNLTFSPYISYGYPMDAIRDFQSQQWWGGAKLSVSF